MNINLNAEGYTRATASSSTKSCTIMAGERVDFRVRGRDLRRSVTGKQKER
jgi:hypothetical protein